MEETNYHRDPAPESLTTIDDAQTSPSKKYQSASEPDGESKLGVSSNGSNSTDVDQKRSHHYKSKSFLTKLKVFDRKVLQYPNMMTGMILRPLIFLSFPVICYSGLSYGSNLIWFNVLNDTASLILSGNSYNFSPSIVGLCYLSPLIGVAIG